MNPPNIVLVLADDLGWSDLGVYGNAFHETPHIDRLAEDGTRFTRWHACPNCAPTRAAMLTGQYGPRTGIYTVGKISRFPWQTRPLRPVDNVENLPLDKRTFADVLRGAGYATALFGKWHLGEKPEFHPSRRGFDEAVTVSTNDHFRFTTDPPRPMPEGVYQSDFLTDLGIDFIRRHKDKPFFLYLPLTAVHSPWQAPQADIDYFRAKGKGKKGANPVYAAMVRALDRSVGRLRDTLKAEGIAGNTVFVFLSDNGGVGGYRRENVQSREMTDNAPLRGGKGMLTDGGTRVPMLVHWPGVTKPGTTCDTPGIHVDFLPTLAEIAGAKLPDQPVDGRSAVPELRDPRAKRPPRPIYQHFPGYLGGEAGDTWRTTPVGTIEYDGWKLLEYFEDGRRELYHIDADPGETKELAAKRPDIASDLLRRMTAWRQEVGAKMPEPNTERLAPGEKPKPGGANNRQRPATPGRNQRPPRKR